MSSNDIKSLSYEIKELSKEMYKRYSEHMTMDDIANITYSVMCTYANDIRAKEEFDRIEEESNKLYLINVYDTNMTNFSSINRRYFKTQEEAREAILQYIWLWTEEMKYEAEICLNKTKFLNGDDRFVFEAEGKFGLKDKLFLEVRGRYVKESEDKYKD